MTNEVANTVIFQSLLSIFFVVMRWQRTMRTTREKNLTTPQRRRHLLKDVGPFALYLLLAIVFNAVFVAVGSDLVELWSIPVLTLALGIWWWIYTMRFRKKYPPTPSPETLWSKFPTRDVTYHDYRLMIYRGGWKKPEGWIIATPFNKEDETHQMKLKGLFYKRGTSVDEIESDLKNKINEHFNLN